MPKVTKSVVKKKKKATKVKSKKLKAPKNPKGRPSGFSEALGQTMLDLYRQGKTEKQIAEIVGVSTQTLFNWKGQHPDFLYALRDAKQIANTMVEAAMFQRAVGYSIPETKVFCNKDGEITTHTIEKHYAPDAGAQAFWLKNRKPEAWADKKEVTGTMTLESLIQESQEPEIIIDVVKDEDDG